MQIVIAGVSLTISTAEEEQYVERLVEVIDDDMQSLLSKTRASVTSAALLLAIDYLDRYQKANVSATNMRTQIKGYLTDAANAKLLFDEEKKRSDMYAREVGEVNIRLEQLQSSASNSDDIKMLMEEHNVLLEERAHLVNQLEHANNLLNTSAASREEEIVKLRNEIRGYAEQLDIRTNEVRGYAEQLDSKSSQIKDYERQLQTKQDDITKLLSEVALLESMLKEYINEEKAVPPQDLGKEFGSLGNDNRVVKETPPLFYTEPPKDLPYEYDDMPNLNWTENL